jgi:hypoxanthine phosphoribosyltransferase
LLRKPARLKKRLQIDYLGFDIPDVWIVGYGLDFQDRDRALPDIRTLPVAPASSLP